MVTCGVRNIPNMFSAVSYDYMDTMPPTQDLILANPEDASEGTIKIKQGHKYTMKKIGNRKAAANTAVGTQEHRHTIQAYTFVCVAAASRSEV